MKHGMIAALAALALAATVTPAHAQSRNPTLADDGVPLCEIDGVVLRHERSGLYTINFFLTVPGDQASAQIGDPGMFAVFRPRAILFYTGRLDEEGNRNGPMTAFGIMAVFGDYARRVPFAPEDMRIRVDAGSVQSPSLPLDQPGASRNIRATLGDDGGGFGASVTVIPAERIATLTDAILSNGATMRLSENGREIARVSIPLGSLAAAHRRALDWVAIAFPLLRDGKCPD